MTGYQGGGVMKNRLTLYHLCNVAPADRDARVYTCMKNRPIKLEFHDADINTATNILATILGEYVRVGVGVVECQLKRTNRTRMPCFAVALRGE